MGPRRENIDLPEDQGCLRWVLGVPLGFLYLPAVYFGCLALAGQPRPGDDRGRADVQAVAGLCLALCVLGLVISLAPVYRRTLGRWWYALPLLLAAVACVRGATV